MIRSVSMALALVLVAGAVTSTRHGSSATVRTAAPLTVEELGQALFFDTDLSLNRTQSCATCHDPAHAFTDPRVHPDAGRAVSLGDDGRSIGDRNTPSAAYAALTPSFRVQQNGEPKGGLFHDGRAADLERQAEGPPLNPIEMGMPDKAAVVARVKEKPDYVAAFTALYGANVFDQPDSAFAAMAKSIAAFERTEIFQPFDSKYDRALRGEEKLTDQEELGRVLFFSNQFANCSQCHKSDALGGAEREPFTSYTYHNIGVPLNRAVRAQNGTPQGHVDAGLGGTDATANPLHRGKFKVPSLRNVAVTGPYMHNGVFRDLETAVRFYNKYNSKSPRHQTNPETGQPWDAPEVGENLSREKLEVGPALDDRRVKAIVAFLKTLTDRRYEHLTTDGVRNSATGNNARLP